MCWKGQEETVGVRGSSQRPQSTDSAHGDLVERGPLASIRGGSTLEHPKRDTVCHERQFLHGDGRKQRLGQSRSKKERETGNLPSRLTVFFEMQLSSLIEYPTRDDMVPTWPAESPSS